jgi:hypothetical protein
MKAIITRKQMDLLLEAAERAKMPGACRYVYEGEPCCVIAQLGALHGASIEKMGEYEYVDDDETGNVSSEPFDICPEEDFALGEWREHVSSLRAVQSEWDKQFESVNEARAALRERISQKFQVRE